MASVSGIRLPVVLFICAGRVLSEGGRITTLMTRFSLDKCNDLTTVTCSLYWSEISNTSTRREVFVYRPSAIRILSDNTPASQHLA